MARSSQRRVWIATLAILIVIGLVLGTFLLRHNADHALSPTVAGTGGTAVTPGTAGTSGIPAMVASDHSLPAELACTLPAWNQAMPTSRPRIDAFEEHDGAKIPVSDTYGPTKRTGKVWGCFQKSPIGAAFAATYISYTDTRAAAWGAYTIGYAQPQSLGDEGKDSTRPEVEVFGFTFTSYKPGDAHIRLATKIPGGQIHGYFSFPLHLIWVDGTWKATNAGLADNGRPQRLQILDGYILWKNPR